MRRLKFMVQTAQWWLFAFALMGGITVHFTSNLIDKYLLGLSLSLDKVQDQGWLAITFAGVFLGLYIFFYGEHSRRLETTLQILTFGCVGEYLALQLQKMLMQYGYINFSQILALLGLVLTLVLLIKHMSLADKKEC